MLSSQVIDSVLERLIDREGGYVHHPADPGGETKFGISKRSYPDLNIKTLSRDEAKAIYLRDFVHAHRLEQLASPTTFEYVLDWLVHSGPSVIGRLQRKLGIGADGVVGVHTLTALDQLEDPKEILRWRLAFLVSLARHPFLSGWIARLVALGL